MLAVVSPVVYLVIQFLMVPFLRNKISSTDQDAEKIDAKNPEKPDSMFSKKDDTDDIKIEMKPDTAIDKYQDSDPEETNKLFSYLQIMTAIFGSFAHGGNDVSNAIGPLIGLWFVYKEGIVLSTSEVPLWILLYGGLYFNFQWWQNKPYWDDTRI